MMATMRCPQCSVDLDETSRPQCPQCDGTFATNADLEQMLDVEDNRREPSARRTMAAWPIGDEHSERHCPVCEKPMFRTTMERVIVERCADHGVWFDQSELQRVLAPNVDEPDYAAAQGPRGGPADPFELGKLGTVVQLVYSQIRRPNQQ
jgi:Zn-finger nucleic acid-binding protein